VIRRAAFALGLLCGCGEERSEPCSSAPSPGAAPYVDVTEELGIAFEHHLATDFCELTDTTGGPGVCALDYDGDGALDLYFVDRAGHPNALYRNEGGRFRDVALEVGAALVDVDAMGCLAFDHDADGDLDLLVTANGPLTLLRNDGGTFKDVSVASGLATVGGFAVSASAGDVDGDLDLDLFVGRVVKLETCPAQCKLFPIACEAESNVLLVNDGGTFRDESEARGITGSEPTLATLMVDVDRDGDLDLYAGNDMGFAFEDRLHRNDGTGHFVDAASAFGLGVKGSDTMGVDVGDYDRDGNMDWVMSDFSDRPVRLLRCYDPTRSCSNEVVPDSLEHVKWGTGFVDVDQDGWLDVVVAGGDVATLDGSPLRLFYQRRGDFLESVPRPDEALAKRATGRGLAFGDLDGDGAVDLALAVAGGRARVLLSRAAAGHSLQVALGTQDVGAVVFATTPDGTLAEHAVIGGSYAGSSDPRLHFGLGEHCSADVEVRFLDGRVERRSSVRGLVRIAR
jgi:hypothetical protein